MKQGDIGTNLVFIVKDENNNFVDLSDAKAVYLVMRLGNQRVERLCNIINPLEGKVQYTIKDGDLLKPGTLLMELRIEFNNGFVFTTSRVSDVVESKL